MKKSWIVAGLVMVVAVGVFMLTTKNANDTKRGDESATGNAETAKQTEMDTSVNFVPSSTAGGEKKTPDVSYEEGIAVGATDCFTSGMTVNATITASGGYPKTTYYSESDSTIVNF